MRREIQVRASAAGNARSRQRAEAIDSYAAPASPATGVCHGGFSVRAPRQVLSDGACGAVRCDAVSR